MDNMEWWRNKAELITKRKENFKAKLQSVGPRIKDLEEVNEYQVKVEDANDTKYDTQKNKRQLTEFEKEQIKLKKEKTQLFMNRISNQIAEKEAKQEAARKEKLIKKGQVKKRIDEETSSESDDGITSKVKEKEFKKVFPVAVCFHQLTKTLVICLIDKEIRVYTVRE